MKDAYYFPHDSNARGDDKSIYIMRRHGVEGYGLYWLFIETMHESADGKLSKSMLPEYAYHWHVDDNTVIEFYNSAITCGLFVEDDENGEFFWSERVIRNKQLREEKRSNKSKAGIAGMQSRWGSDNAVITDDNSTITKHNKGKERKGKERKIKDKKHTARDADIEKLFELFWSKYPRRDAKVEAKKAFAKQFPYELSDEECTARLQNMGVRIGQLLAEKRERKHIPLPATFLNREDFSVEPEPIDTGEYEFVEVENG